MTGAYALRDSATMLRRNLLHLRRYPGLSLFPILTLTPERGSDKVSV
jgi:hypothetical protein